MIVLDSAVVEKEAEPVVAEVAESARGALGVLDLQVQGFGRPVGDVGVGEVRGTPPAMCAMSLLDGRFRELGSRGRR